MERECVRNIGQIMNFKNADGILFPGGTYCNFTALLLARNYHFPEIRKQGITTQKLVCFVSEQAHFSIARSCAAAGIGVDNCISIPANIKGEINVNELEKQIVSAKKAGKQPFFVNTTAGTTVLGGFDDFSAVADVCKEHNIWMHVDGAWGGSAILTHPQLMKGTERCDSFAWNMHKHLGVPLQCSITMTNNHPGELERTFLIKGEYIFHEQEADYDQAKKTFQCGRKSDAVKLWLMWKYYGTEGFRQRIQYAVQNSQKLTSMLKSFDKGEIKQKRTSGGIDFKQCVVNQKFILVVDPTWCNVCFWYVPSFLHGNKFSDISKKLDRVTNLIKAKMQQRGNLLIDFSSLQSLNLPSFFRVIVNSTRVVQEDLDFIIDEIESIGESINPSEVNQASQQQTFKL